MRSVRVYLVSMVLGVAVAGCSGSNPVPTGTAILPVAPNPIAEALYVGDATAGTILEASVTPAGQLTALQTTPGLLGVSCVVAAPDGNALYALVPGAIQVFCA